MTTQTSKIAATRIVTMTDTTVDSPWMRADHVTMLEGLDERRTLRVRTTDLLSLMAALDADDAVIGYEPEVEEEPAPAASAAGPTTYYAVMPQDVGTCEALGWAWLSVRPYVVARGEDEDEVREEALRKLGWADDAEIHIHAE